MTDEILSGKITAGVNTDHTGVVMIYNLETVLYVAQHYESYQEYIMTSRKTLYLLNIKLISWYYHVSLDIIHW